MFDICIDIANKALESSNFFEKDIFERFYFKSNF